VALVMFDYDGVIVDSLSQVSGDFIAACQHNGYADLHSVDEFIELFEGNVYESLGRQGVEPQVIDRILGDYKVYAAGHLSQLSVFPGICQALERIAAKNTVVVITSNISSLTSSILQQNGIASFREVIGAEIEKSKIKKIHLTMERYRDRPAYYVGDTLGDMLEGRQAGALTVAATWGWHTAERLSEARPDFMAASPEGLAELLAAER
jgi:phosphoglycolate phosphatase